MRFHFTFELQNEEIDIDYRRRFISYLKFCTEKSNRDFYEELYGKGRNTNKDFTTSVYFVPETQFNAGSICVKSKRLILNLSTPDAYTGIQLYNALCAQKFVWYKISETNQMRLLEIHNEKEKVVTQNMAVFNTLSPIVIRDHDRETGKDWFYTFEDEAAVDILKRNLKQELEGKFQRDISYDIEKLKFTSITMKVIIVKSYALKIPCSLGAFSVEGEQYLLQYLYQRGLGSKKGLIFGMLELV